MILTNDRTSWPSENVSGQTKRAVAVAMQITIGDTGAIAGVLIYRPAFAGHRYRKPHIIAIGYLLFSIVVATYLWTWMRRENNRRNRLGEEGKVGAKQAEANESIASANRLGDRDPSYRYQLWTQAFCIKCRTVVIVPDMQLDRNVEYANWLGAVMITDVMNDSPSKNMLSGAREETKSMPNTNTLL